MIAHIPVKLFRKGDMLFDQGGPVCECFFVIEGCARKFSIDEEGREVTSEFYIENQSITI